jgi:signal transduction histidine kinase
MAPVWDSHIEPGEDRETDLLNALRLPTFDVSPLADTLVARHADGAAATIAMMERRARNDGWLARIVEICNAATDEAALAQCAADETARWATAAAVAVGGDLRAFATRDPAGESATAAVFHAAIQQLASTAPHIHYLREVALPSPLGAATAAAGYHTLAIAPIVADGEPAGALLAAARGAAILDAAALATLARAADAVGVALGRLRQIARLRVEMEALAAAMRHKDDFLASVSHELRTPLTAILGFAHIIVENDALGAARRRGMAEDIVASGGLLLTQVNDLLDIVQLGAGRLSVPLMTVDVTAAVQWCARAVAPLMKSKGLNFAVEVAPILPLARANKARLEQVVLNLLVNAYKFTSVGGTVTFTAERALDRITLSVTDTGIGIAPEHLARIFEPFERIETEYSRTQSGAGVGLAVARRLVEMMHGTLAVDSTPNVGSTFTVTIPVSDE